MELRHLRYFAAVARAGSITAAARELGIQQPPLSQQLRDLERELGFALFDRRPRGVSLTPGGAVFLEEAEALLSLVQAGVRRAAGAASGTVGSVRIGLTSSALMHRLAPELLRRFREGFPAVDLSVDEGNAAILSERVSAGQLDAALIRRPVAERSGLAYHELDVEPLLLALPAAHPVAVRAAQAGRDRVRLADLADTPFILVRRPGAPGMYGDLIEACHAAGFAPRVVAEVGQMLTNVTLVAAGVGVTVVPASMRPVHAGAVFYASASDAPHLAAPLTLMTRIGSMNPALDRLVGLARELGPGRKGRASGPASRPAKGATRAGASPRRSPPGRAPARKR